MKMATVPHFVGFYQESQGRRPELGGQICLQNAPVPKPPFQGSGFLGDGVMDKKP